MSRLVCRLLQGALSIPLVVFAQAPDISNVVVEQSYGTALIRYVISGVPGGQPTHSVVYGTDPQQLVFENPARTTSPVSMPSAKVLQAGPLGALRANTIYYFRPRVLSKVNSPTTSSWDCLAAMGGVTSAVEGEAGCHAATGLGWFRTLPLPANFGSEDQVPAPDVSSLPKAPPAPTLPPLRVAAGDADDLKSKLTECAKNTNGTGDVQEVLLPGGAEYLARVNLPQKKVPGICIVRTDDMARLPPDGVRISPAYAPVMATLSTPYIYSGQSENPPIGNAHTVVSSGWYFLGLRFSTEKGVPETYTVADVSDDGQITIDSKELGLYGLPTFAVIQVWGVKGSWTHGRGPNGVFQIAGWTNGGKTFRLNGLPSLSCPGKGCYQGGGSFRISAGIPICHAANTAPIRLTTCVQHGLVERWRIPIRSIARGSLTVEAGHGIPGEAKTYEVIVEDSSVPEWNGVWPVASTDATSVRIEDAPRQTCNTDCGTVRLLDPLHVKYVKGNTAANGTSYYTVVSPTEIELPGSAGNGEYISGGIVAEETSHWNNLAQVGYRSEQVHFDRCLFQPGDWPKRTSMGLVHRAGQSSIINNYFDDIQFYRLVRRTGKRKALDAFSSQQYYIATATAIDTTAGDTKLIENNYLESHGINVYSQEVVNWPPFTNVVIRRNVFYTDDTKRAGSPLSDGLYYPHRHHLEWKRGTRFHIDGNQFIGGWIDYNACGPMIAASPRGGAVIRDLKFTNNTIRGGTTGLYLIGTDDRSDSLTPLVSNVYFGNNIVRDMDGYRKSVPHDAAVNPAYCGFPLYVNGGVESFTVTHNLFDRSRGARTQTFAFQSGRGSGLTITNNILWFTNDENAGPLWKQGSMAAGSAGKPIATGTTRQVFDALWSHSMFSNNIVIPGVQSTMDASRFDSTLSSDVLSHQDCASYFSGFENVFCGGSRGALTSARQNMEFLRLVDYDKLNFRLAPDSPARTGSPWSLDGRLSGLAQIRSNDGKDLGPDHEALESAQGQVHDVRLTNVGTNEATLTYVAPDAAPCFVDFSAAPFPAISESPRRVGDGGGERKRRVLLSDLGSGTRYYVRLLCASEQPSLEFVTK